MQAVDVNTNETVVCLHDANTRFVLHVNDTLHTNSLKMFRKCELAKLCLCLQCQTRLIK